jgi:uncharacterized BrkB/YihY/UPF0761 family membrane protein
MGKRALGPMWCASLRCRVSLRFSGEAWRHRADDSLEKTFEEREFLAGDLMIRKIVACSWVLALLVALLIVSSVIIVALIAEL